MKFLKSTFLFVFFFALAINALGQPPLKFNYQAVLRNEAGQVIQSQEVTVTISILQGSAQGQEVFSETHNTQTNEFGLINLQIGSVESLAGVSWADDTFFIRVSADDVVMGTTQLLSVPFALHSASSADSFSGDYNDLNGAPELGAFIQVEEPQDGDILFFDGQLWQTLPAAQEGMVLMVIDGLPQWAQLPEEGGDEPGTVSDIDGNIYPTVIIGQQEWMAENLRVTHYSDGTPIPGGLTNEQWIATTEGALAVFPHGNVAGIDSEEQMIEYYGRLYNWYAVNNSKGLCPTGWKVPDYDDWHSFNAFLNSDGNAGQEGNVLKNCRQVGSDLGGDCDTSIHPRWNADTFNNNYGTDAYDFSGLPSGYRGNTGNYFAIGMLALYWSSTESGENTGWHRHLSVNGSILNIDNIHQKISGFSVRCIKE